MFTFSILKPVEFRQATCGDIDEICGLYEKFTNDDYQKLVVFPPQIRREKIAETITHNKLFVAYDDNNIVGFVKLFPIENVHENQNILSEELSLNQIPLFNGSGILTEKVIGEYSQQLEFSEPHISEAERSSLIAGAADCLYIYYGGAYTIPEYRNSCINSQLIHFALANIVQSQYLQKRFSHIAMIYGQVEANQHKQGMIRIFAHEIMQFYSLENVQIFYLVCIARKPNFDFDILTEKIVIKGFERGFGNMIIYKTSGENV